MLSVLVTFALFWLASFLLREAAVAQVRQKLFKLRDDLFVMWANTGLEFDHPAYTRRRSALNASIRFAHKSTVLQVGTLALGRPLRRLGEQLADEKREATEELEDYGIREYLEWVDDEHQQALGSFLLFGSYSGLMLAALLVVYVVATKMVSAPWSTFGEWIGLFGLQAEGAAFDSERCTA